MKIARRSAIIQVLIMMCAVLSLSCTKESREKSGSEMSDTTAWNNNPLSDSRDTAAPKRRYGEVWRLNRGMMGMSPFLLHDVPDRDVEMKDFFDTASNLLARDKADKKTRYVVYSPNGKMAARLDADGEIYVHPVGAKGRVTHIDLQKAVPNIASLKIQCLAFSPDNTRLAIGLESTGRGSVEANGIVVNLSDSTAVGYASIGAPFSAILSNTGMVLWYAFINDDDGGLFPVIVLCDEKGVLPMDYYGNRQFLSRNVVNAAFSDDQDRLIVLNTYDESSQGKVVKITAFDPHKDVFLAAVEDDKALLYKPCNFQNLSVSTDDWKPEGDVTTLSVSSVSVAQDTPAKKSPRHDKMLSAVPKGDSWAGVSYGAGELHPRTIVPTEKGSVLTFIDRGGALVLVPLDGEGLIGDVARVQPKQQMQYLDLSSEIYTATYGYGNFFYSNYSRSRNITLIRTGIAGDAQKDYCVRMELDGAPNDPGVTIVPLADGGCYLLVYPSYLAHESEDPVTILRIATDGSLVWSRRIECPKEISNRSYGGHVSAALCGNELAVLYNVAVRADYYENCGNSILVTIKANGSGTAAKQWGWGGDDRPYDRLYSTGVGLPDGTVAFLSTECFGSRFRISFKDSTFLLQRYPDAGFFTGEEIESYHYQKIPFRGIALPDGSLNCAAKLICAPGDEEDLLHEGNVLSAIDGSGQIVFMIRNDFEMAGLEEDTLLVSRGPAGDKRDTVVTPITEGPSRTFTATDVAVPINGGGVMQTVPVPDFVVERSGIDFSLFPVDLTTEEK